MKGIIQRLEPWRECSEGQKVGTEIRARESHFLHEEQPLENARLEIYFMKLRDRRREEFVH